jgi:hypothetical protein
MWFQGLVMLLWTFLKTNLWTWIRSLKLKIKSMKWKVHSSRLKKETDLRLGLVTAVLQKTNTDAKGKRNDLNFLKR